MSVELREVRRRMAATRKVQQVTTALQKVANARMARYRALALASNRYEQELAHLVLALRRVIPGEHDNPLLHANGSSRDVAVVLGSDRGLCGGFNSSLVVTLEKHAGTGRNTGVIAVGRVVARRARRAGFDLAATHDQPTPDRLITFATLLADGLCRGFLARQHGSAHVIYARIGPGGRQAAVVEPVLPVTVPDAAPPPTPDPWPAALFEPDAPRMLRQLLAHWVAMQLYHAAMQSLAAENAARQAAMTRATENATEMLADLALAYSRLRQEGITTEMLELVGGMGDDAFGHAAGD